MESQIIWAITLLLFLVFFVPYFLRFRRQQRKGTKQKEEALRLGSDRPVAQYPQIDSLRCIGCGSCVAACPEGGVLGVVNGKATILNGLKCVGHGLCAEACPVEAIRIGLGDIKQRDDIPAMNEYNETNIPGIYIAGELSGLALIRNAITQGRQVVETIQARRALEKINTGNKSVTDVIIIGAGPAGLSATLTAIKYNLSYMLIDQQEIGGTILQYPRKKLVMTRPVELPLYGWLNRPEYSKEELLQIWQEVRDKFQIQVRTGEKLEQVRKENGHFQIQTSKGIFLGRQVVLALGRRGTPRKLNVTGEDQSKVMYKLMDAGAYQNEHLLVVGGGDSAVEAAIGLARQKGNTVTISYRKDKFFRIKRRNEEHLDEMLLRGNINVLLNSHVLAFNPKSVSMEVQGVKQEIPNDYVFIFAGGEPPFELLKKIGIRFGK
jgi:putative YpdA family bacillithiol system oxidoreductase